MKSNNFLSFVPQRFWDPKEGRMIHAQHINFDQKLITEQGNSKRYKFTGSNPDVTTWVMPTMQFDSNNKMMYQHDIVNLRGTMYRIDFIDSLFRLVDSEDRACSDLYYESGECEVVGNMFESGNLLYTEES